MVVTYFIGSAFPPQYRGGEAIAGFFLAKALIKRGNRVRVIVPAYDYLESEEFVRETRAEKIAHLDNGIDVYLGSYEGVEIYFLSGGYLGISQMFDFSQPHIRIGRAVDFSSSLDFFDFSDSVVHLRDPYFSPVLNYLKNKRVPTIFEAHMLYGDSVLFDPQAVSSLGLDLDQGPFLFDSKVSFERVGLELSDSVVAVSPWLKQDLSNFYGHYSGKIGLITNGIDLDFFNPSEISISREDFFAERGIAKAAGKKVVLHASSLDFRKGTDLVVDAAKSLLKARDDLLFIFSGIFGSKEYADMVFSLIDKYPGSVHYIGHTRYEDMPALYHFSDVLLHPSRYEPFGLAVLEAASMGTVPVVSDIPIFSDALGKDFEFRCSLDPEDLRKKTILALDQLHNVKESLPAIRKRLSEDYSWDAQAAQFVSIYKKLLAD